MSPIIAGATTQSQTWQLQLSQVALDLRTTQRLMLTMAAHEGGWSTKSLDHNQPLNNPFGLHRTHKGIAVGNVQHPDLDAALRYWKDKYGPRVQGKTDATSFVFALQHPTPGQGQPYNSGNAGYSDEFVGLRKHGQIHGCLRDRLMLVRALLLFVIAAASAAAQCAPDPAAVLQYPTYKYRGLYENRAYGFAVTIPKRFMGLYNRDPNYLRGFTILLAGRRAAVTVMAPVNSLEYANARAAAEGDLSHYEKHGRKILSSDFEQAKMGDRPAVTLRVRYTCPPSGTEYLALETLAIRDNVHSIIWEGPATEFDEASRTLVEKLKRTWKFIGVR